MKKTIVRYYVIVTVTLVLILGLGGHWHWQAVSLFSGVAIASALVVWLTRYPLAWIIGLCIYAELKSVLPIGTASLVVAWPWVWKQWLRVENPDGSRRFWGTIILISMFQIMTWLSGEWWQVRSSLSWPWSWWIQLPWLQLFLGWIITASMSGLLAWFTRTAWWPHEQHGVASIDQQKIRYI